MEKKRSVAFEIITCLQYAGLKLGYKYDSCKLITKKDLVAFTEKIIKDPNTSKSLKDQIGCRGLMIKPMPKAKFLRLALKKLQSVG